MALVAGSKTQHSSGDAEYHHISAPLSSSVIMTAYRQDSTNDAIYVMGTSVSGTTLTVDSGPTQLDTGALTFTGAPGGIAPLTATTGVVSYIENGSDDGYMVHADVSGGTVTFGTPVDCSATVDVVGLPIATLTSTKVIMGLVEQSSTDVKAVVADLSGTTITPGTVTSIDSGTNSGQLSICAMDSTHAIILGVDSADDPFVYAVSISGTTITAGSKTVLQATTANAANGLSITSLSDTIALAVWCDGFSPTLLKACAMSLSGTTVTPGTVVTVTTGGGSNADIRPVVNKLSTSMACLTWARNGAIGGKVKTLSISGTTITDNADDLVYDSTALGTDQASTSSVFSGTSKIYVAYRSTTTPSGEALVITGSQGPYDWTFNPAGIPGSIKVA